MASIIRIIFHALISGLFVTSIPNFFFHKFIFSFFFPSPVLAAAPDRNTLPFSFPGYFIFYYNHYIHSYYLYTLHSLTTYKKIYLLIYHSPRVFLMAPIKYLFPSKFSIPPLQFFYALPLHAFFITFHILFFLKFLSSLQLQT